MNPDEKTLYRNLHFQFSDRFVSTGNHVMEFYPAWKNFVETNGSEIGLIVNNFSTVETDESVVNGFERLFYFLKDFKDYAMMANGIMAQYNTLCNQSNAYMKKAFMLKENNEAVIGSNKPDELIPELTAIITGFKEIEEKTRLAVQKLKVIQTEWGKIRERVKDP